MQREKIDALLLCEPDPTAERVRRCLRGDRRVSGAEYMPRLEPRLLSAGTLPGDTVRLLVLDDVRFDRQRARQYLNIFRSLPHTAAGLLLHGGGAVTALREAWHPIAVQAGCAGVLTADAPERETAAMLDSALRRANAPWPGKCVSRVPEAAFLVSGAVGADGCLRGRIWNRYLAGPRAFCGIEELLFSLDALSDDLDFPQRYCRPRSLTADGGNECAARFDYRLFVPDTLDLRPGRIFFCVRMRARAFCSMQGELCGAAAGKRTVFQSADELAAQILNIMRDAGPRADAAPEASKC